MGVAAPLPDDWAGVRGERWLRDLDVMEAMLEPIGAAALQNAGHRPGEHVIDIGCGGGWTTRQIGAAVGPAGTVLGLDICPSLVAEATRRARDMPQLRFMAGDAATVSPPGGPFDRLFSRFGVMFFMDPPAAFGHLASMLAPGARLDLAVWGNPRRNPWMMEMRRVVGTHVEVPSPEPLAPGPFQLADPAYHEPLLEGAGFTGIERNLLEIPLHLGGPGATPAAAAAFALSAFSIGELAEAAGPSVHAAVSADLERLYEAHLTPEGVAMPAAIWLLSARRT